MKVKELIEKLKQFDGDLPVYSEVSYEGYIDEVVEVELCSDLPDANESEIDFILIGT